MKKLTAILLFIILIMIFVFALNYSFDKTKTGKDKEDRVLRVIDGDTFELYNGERVRSICIDSPELGSKGGEESKEFLVEMIEDSEFRLEKDSSETDKYGRLLRYVYVGEVFVNREMVKQGYASVFRYGNDTKRCDEIEGSKN